MKYFKAKMGISIVACRVAIGSFTQPNKQRSCVHGLKVPINLYRKGLQWIVFMSLLLIVSGDIECNPGPRGRGKYQQLFTTDNGA